MIRGLVLLSAAAFCLSVLHARQAAEPAQVAEVSNGQQANPASSADHGTGVVPPGVTLVPTMPAAGPSKAFQFPSAATKTLANGLRVYVVTDHAEPSIAAQLLIMSAGSIQDSPTMPGVAEMSANMLTQGTTKRSAKEIADAIDFVGGSLAAAAGKDATTVSLNIVKKDLNHRVRPDVRRCAASSVSGE